MEKQIVEEICRSLKWYEKVIVYLHKKIIMKIYHTTRFRIFNENN